MDKKAFPNAAICCFVFLGTAREKHISGSRKNILSVIDMTPQPASSPLCNLGQGACRL